MNDQPQLVSHADRCAFERQRAALTDAANDDEGTAEWEASVVKWANVERESQGTPALQDWWESKTETELHERARALGLLG